MKTLCTQKPSFSDDAVHLHVPHSWGELTQEQLRYVLGVLTIDWQDEPLVWSQTLMLMRFAGFRLERMTDKGWLCFAADDRKKTFVLTPEAVAGFLTQLDWIFEDGTCSVRLEECQGRKAADAELYGVTFEDYLHMENLYQAYLQDPTDNSPLVALANKLYPSPDPKDKTTQMFEPAELYGAFLWYRHVKVLFAEQFPNLFRPSSSPAGEVDMREVMNAQIRALTDGDVTRHQKVLKTEAVVALTELDAKAKEAQDLKQQTKK